MRKNNPVSAVILRGDPNDRRGVPGEIQLWQGDDLLFERPVLERDYKNNERDVSSIPLGDYEIHKRSVGDFAARAHKLFNHPYTFWIKPVEGRDFILIHWGNFLSATKGCVLIGSSHGVHNGENCVWQSQKAYRQFFRTTEHIFATQEFIPLSVKDGLDEESADISNGDRSNL